MKPIPIDRVRIHRGQMPVRVAFSYGKVNHFPFVLVRLESAGVEGIGEVVVPSNRFLEDFLPKLLGCDARALDGLLPVAGADHDRVLCETVSMALYDLVARVSGLPLCVLLGGDKSKVVPLMPCIFPNNAREARDKARCFFEQGFRYLKIKLVGDLREDCDRVAAVRAVVPREVVLQGDANEGYHSLQDAQCAVDQCGAAGLDIFEDPLRGGVDDYRRLCEKKRESKIMVDVLARRTDDLLAVLRAGAADIINIHPDQAGSLSRVMQHARLAQSYQMPVAIGGTGYTAVGTAAYQHVTAVATPGGPCGELGGVFDHGMPCSLIQKPLPMRNGCTVVTEEPGTGVELDEDAVALYQQGYDEWR